MAEYIDREALLNSLRESYSDLKAIFDSLKYDNEKEICKGQIATFIECILRVKDSPAADVEEVKHGRWDNNGRCTCCGGHAPYYAMASTYYKSPYCFECGAKMYGGKENEIELCFSRCPLQGLHPLLHFCLSHGESIRRRLVLLRREKR